METIKHETVDEAGIIHAQCGYGVSQIVFRWP